jgi:hypothetical protein
MVNGLIEMPVILPQCRRAGTPADPVAQKISPMTME